MNCSFDSAKQLAACGGVAVGRVSFVPGKKGNAARFERGAFVTFASEGNFNPAQGTVQMWVNAGWDPRAAERHCFFHLGTSLAHVTVFKTELQTIRFVYKASPREYYAVRVPIAGWWRRGEWHFIRASWAKTYGGLLALLLEVDGRRSIACGAAPLRSLPPRFYVGARGPRAEFAEAAIDEFQLSAEPTGFPYLQTSEEPVAATVDFAQAGRPLARVHQCTTLWNSQRVPLPFVVGDETFRRFAEAKFRLARIVATSETWLWGARVERDEQGRLRVDCTDLDRLLELVHAAGAEGYLRIAYHMPRALSSRAQEKQPKVWAYAPPQSWAEWDDVVRQIVVHCVRDKRWRIPYWVCTLNEADAPAMRGLARWDTNLEVYRRTTRIVRELAPRAKVGGPAICTPLDGFGGEALRSFLSFCRQNRLPLDFVCFHAYRKMHPAEFEQHALAVKKIVAEANPQLKPEFILDEWNLWVRDRRQDNEFGAAYVAAALHYQRRAGLAFSSFVAFNDFRYAQPGGRFAYSDETIAQSPLPMIKGPVATPIYFVFLMHSKLKDTELPVALDGRGGITSDNTAGITATADDREAAILLWHFNLFHNTPKRFVLRLERLRKRFGALRALRIEQYLIDRTHTNAYYDYVVLGKDSAGGRYNLATGQLDLVDARHISVARAREGSAKVSLVLRDMSVALLVVRPVR